MLISKTVSSLVSFYQPLKVKSLVKLIYLYMKNTCTNLQHYSPLTVLLHFKSIKKGQRRMMSSFVHINDVMFSAVPSLLHCRSSAIFPLRTLKKVTKCLLTGMLRQYGQSSSPFLQICLSSLFTISNNAITTSSLLW